MLQVHRKHPHETPTENFFCVSFDTKSGSITTTTTDGGLGNGKLLYGFQSSSSSSWKKQGKTPEPLPLPHQNDRKAKRRNDEKCRLYREQKKKYEASLVGNVKRLREEVDQLRGLWETKHFKTRHSLQGSLTQLAIEYFNVFHYGMKDTIGGTGGGGGGGGGHQLVPTRQELFLQHTTDPDVFRFNDIYGIKTLCDQWYKYTAYHKSLAFEFDQVDIKGQHQDQLVVIVRGHMAVEFSKETFEYIFPSAQSNPQLIEQLIGTKMIYPVQTCFGFNSNGQMTSVQGVLDFVPALVNTLGIHQAMALCHSARIHSGCVIEEIETKEELDEPMPQVTPTVPSTTTGTPTTGTTTIASMKYSLKYLLNN